MNVPAILDCARRFTRFIDAPDGPRLNKLLGTIAANWGRIQRDAPALENFMQELLPLIQKHWKPVLSSSNDLIPIIELIIQEAKS